MVEAEYTLYYFGFNARGANVRALLSVGKVNWKNQIVEHKDLPDLKASGKLEYGQLPALEHKGKFYTQTIAIEVLLARKFNLLGSDEEEEYQILSLLASREDILKVGRPVFLQLNDDEKANLEKNKKEFFENQLPKFLNVFSKRLGDNSYLVGNKFSLADIFVVVFLKTAFDHASRKDEFGPVLDKHSKLREYVDRVAKNELADYFKNHYNENATF